MFASPRQFCENINLSPDIMNTNLADSSDILHVKLRISRIRKVISKIRKKEKENRQYPYQKKYHFPVEVFCYILLTF